MLETDFLIVGAGIAGASIAYQLAPHARVLIIDMEDQAGYHTTGRSAAFYAETYGGVPVQPLTSASKAFFTKPPVGFSDVPLMSKLGAIHVFLAGQEVAADELYHSLHSALPGVQLLSRAEVLSRQPYLQADGIAGGIYDPDCSSLDVAALHQGFLRRAKAEGATLLTDASFEGASFSQGRWHVVSKKREFSARVIVNTAGAWADAVALSAGVTPLGLEPLRRTVITVQNPSGLPFEKTSPITMHVGAEHYFKPEGAGYLISPGDEVLMSPTDVQPEQEDVARAVYQFEQATGAAVTQVEAKWAGLRTFARDRAPIIGFAPDAPQFFWSVGQGGFGIQTAPAWSELAASMLVGSEVPKDLLTHGVAAEAYTPARFLEISGR